MEESGKQVKFEDNSVAFPEAAPNTTSTKTVDEPPTQKPEHIRNTSLLKATFNLTKSAIGLGAVFLPGNLQRMGLLGGISMILMGAFTSAISLHLLSQMSHYLGVADYFELGMHAYGPRMAMVDTIALILFQIGGLIAYCKFAGSYFSSAIQLFLNTATETVPWWRSYQFLSIILGCCFIFPLSLMKDMSKLGYTSIAGMTCIFYIAGLTVVDFIIEGRVPGADYTLLRIKSDFLSAFSSILFAFVNQFTLVSLIPVLLNPSRLRRASLISSSASIVTTVYLCMGISGYLHFGDQVARDILSAPTKPSIAYGIARLLVSVVLVCSYPLQLDPTRSALDHLFGQFLSSAKRDVYFRTFYRRHVIWTLLLVLVPLLIAVTAADYAEPILEVFSSACGALLVFVLPAAYFLKLSAKGTKMPVRFTEKILAYFILIFGAVVCVGGTIGAIIDIVRRLRGQI